MKIVCYTSFRKKKKTNKESKREEDKTKIIKSESNKKSEADIKLSLYLASRFSISNLF